MDFVELHKRVKSRTTVDVEPLMARYRADTPSASVNGFLAYLLDQDIIDTRLFAELHTSGAVDMTAATFVEARTNLRSSAGADLRATKASAMHAALAQDAAPQAAPASDQEEEKEAQYEVLGELGKGAMGEVHLARDYVLRRKVALKSILPHMQENTAMFSRFLAEMQITAQLDHPFIVPVYGVDTGPSGGLAYTMKLVQGRELGDLLDETKAMLDAGKPLDAAHGLEARLDAFLKVCDAIAYAHERGVVHRDLKPANIMLGPFNQVYVMDWGIARLMGNGGSAQDKGVEIYDAEGEDARQATRTRVGSTIGTPIYMSPEQAAGKNDELDGRSDLYGLGLVLQELLTLTRAVGGTTLQEVLTNAKDGRRVPPEPPAKSEAVPREIRAIVDKATRFHPNDRYASVDEFAADIRRYMRNEAILAQPDSGLQGAGRWISRHRMASIAVFLLALVLGAGATIGVLLYNRAALAMQHQRELRLAELQASSAMQAQNLDATLQTYETLVTRMTGAAGLALGEVKVGEATLHFSDDFKPGASAPSGLVDSAFHGALVSFDWPVASLAPGTTKEMVTGELAAANSLRALARAIMLTSLDPNHHGLSDEARQRALYETGTPISRISLTLESGLHLEYPGRAGLAPDFDARKTPAYIEASAAYEPAWGKPVPGPKGGMVLPCSAPLRDHDGALLGVITFDIDLERTVSSTLETPAEGHVETSLLVERDGKVLAQRNSPGVVAESETLGLASVREALARGESGYAQTQRNGHDVLVTYHPLSTVGWYMVTVANLDAIERSEVTPGTRGGSVAAKTAAVSTAEAKPVPPRKPVVTPQPAPPTAEPSAEPSASTSASASAPPVASSPALTGRIYRPDSAAPSAQPPPPPSPANPFEPWKVYEKGKPK